MRHQWSVHMNDSDSVYKYNHLDCFFTINKQSKPQRSNHIERAQRMPRYNNNHNNNTEEIHTALNLDRDNSKHAHSQ